MDILSKSSLKNTFASIKEKTTDFCVKPSKKRLAITLSLILILFLVPFYPAQAGFLEDLVTTALLFGPYLLIWIFTGLAVVFVYIATWLVDAALAPGIYMGVINSAAIDRGWVIMRDTANLFFILILIFIAVATTLRLSSYSAKTWIPKLLFAAVFINFSKTITMFIIDIGNMFMYGAIGWMGQGIENTGIGSLAATVSGLFWAVSPFQWELITITKMVEVFTAFLFSLILALTLLGFGMLLLIRVTMLAILTIFSPIAFMLHAWPNAGKYSGQWWGSLLKYIVFGPIIVFFLFIAGEMATTLFSLGAFAVPPTNTLGDPSNPMSVNMGAFSTFFGTLIPYTIIIIILLSGLKFTSDMGVYGAGIIMGSVKGLAAAGGLVAGGLAAKSVLNKGIRGAGWAKGAWQAGKKGGLRGPGGLLDYGKKTAKGMPRQFWDGTKDIATTPFRGIKDSYGMFRNQKDRKDIDIEKKKMELLNKSSDDMRKEMKSSALSPAERAARLERMAEKKDLTEDDKKYLSTATALGTNLNKKLLAEAMPSWAGDLKQSKNKPATNLEQVSNMYEDGTLWNKTSIEGLNKEVLRNLEEVIPDPSEIDRGIERKSKKAREYVLQNYKAMLGGTGAEQKDFDEMKNGFELDPTKPASKQGIKNFNRAKRVVMLQGGDIEDTFRKYDSTTGLKTAVIDKKAVQRFAQENYKDFGYLEKEKDLQALVQNEAITTNIASHIRAENLDPHKCSIIWKEVERQYVTLGNASYKDVYDYMANSPLWGKK